MLAKFTFEFPHGNNIPNVKTNTNAPFVTPDKLIDIWNKIKMSTDCIKRKHYFNKKNYLNILVFLYKLFNYC